MIFYSSFFQVKYQCRLVIEQELGTALPIVPRFENICTEKQAQPSHYIFITLDKLYILFFVRFRFITFPTTISYSK